MLGNIQVSLQMIANYGLTIFLVLVSVAILCGDPSNPAITATAATSTTNSISQQACQTEGCIFYMSSQLYVSIGWMEFRDIIVNGSMITLDTKDIDADYGGGMSMMTATNYSINFTYSYGDEEKFFNISMIFWMDMDRHNWSLVMVAYQSSDDQYSRGEVEYGEDYEDDYYYSDEDYYAENKTILTLTYPFWIGATENAAYSCDDLAGVSNNSVSGSELHIFDIVIQAFHADENNPPNKVTDCTASTSDGDSNTALILGVIAGAAVVITAIIVISTYLYRRRRRGKYNLLD